jgi:hypothetical protein
MKNKKKQNEKTEYGKGSAEEEKQDYYEVSALMYLEQAAETLGVLPLMSNKKNANQHIKDLTKILDIASGYYNPPLKALCELALHLAETELEGQINYFNTHGDVGTVESDIEFMSKALKTLRALVDLSSALCPTKLGEETCFDGKVIP